MRLSLSSGRVPLSSGDWLIISCIGVLTLLFGYWLLTTLSFAFTSEVPAHGGSVTEGIVGTPRFINPVLALSDADRDMTRLVYSGLMRPGTDGVVPDLAESYSISDDGKSYTFTLRSDALFHDGEPVTADDVAFTIDLIQDPAVKSPRRANWEGVIVTTDGPHTVTFTLKETYTPFLENTDLGILPKHVWKDVRTEELPFSKLNIAPIGSGPFRVEKLTTNSAGIPETLVLHAFREAAHPPYINSFEFHFYGDTAQLEQALTSHSSMGAHSVSPDRAPSRAVHEAVLGRVFGVFFNQNQNNLFASRSVRLALDTALDKEELVRILIAGYGSVAEGPLPKEVSDTGTPRDHLAEAAALLEKDGWKKGDDGVYAKTVKKSTTRLEFSLATGNAPELKHAGELVEKAWRELGASVTVQYFDQSDLQQDVIRPRKYDALLFGEVVGRDADLFAFWDSSQRNDPGLNIALYTNSTVDSLLRKARTESDPKARAELSEKAARIITDETAAVFLYSPHFVYLTDPALKGLTVRTIVTPSDRFANVSDWYLDTERVWPFFK